MHKLASFMNIAYGPEVHRSGIAHYFNDHQCFREFYRLVLDPSSDVVDLGFNVGLQAEIILQLTNGKVYGVEASRRIFLYAQERFANEPRVRLFNFAVSDRVGVAEFIDTDEWGAGSLKHTAGMRHCCTSDRYQKYDVDLIRIDDLFPNQQNVGLIKIDIEGGELPALDGARRFIERNRPYIVMEYCHNSLSFEFRGQPIVADTLRDLAAEIGYKIYNIYGVCLTNQNVYSSSILKDTADVFLIPNERHLHWVEQQLPVYQYRILDKFLEKMEWPCHAESDLHYGISALPSRLYEYVNSCSLNSETFAHFRACRDKLHARLKSEREIRENEQLSERGKILLLLIYFDHLALAIQLARSKNVLHFQLKQYSDIISNSAIGGAV